MNDAAMFWAAVTLIFMIHHLPIGSIAKYPLDLLGTWAHEVGHCVVGELLGDCIRLVVRPDGGGAAWSRASSPVDRAMISASGILGPAVLAAAMLVATRRFGRARASLLALALGLGATPQLWAEDAFTTGACSAGAAVIFGASFLPPLLRSMFAQLVAIAMGMYTITRGWDYAYVDSFERDGSHFASDTARIVEVLGGPFEFWAASLCAVSGLILIVAYLASTANRPPNRRF
ncbi:MAG: M50 family metallopeptidase [Pseudomonadota bacterium]